MMIQRDVKMKDYIPRGRSSDLFRMSFSSRKTLEEAHSDGVTPCGTLEDREAE
jgi:hypothetical protein